MFDLWIWGVVVSSILGLPASAYALYDINRNNKNFKKRYDKRGVFRNTFHFLKSVAKIFIPFVNVILALNLLVKLINYGFKGLKSIWIERIDKSDERLLNFKKIFKAVGIKIVSPISRLFEKKNKAEAKTTSKEVTKSNTTEHTKKDTPVLPVKNTNVVIDNKQVKSNKPAAAIYDAKKDPNVLLAEYLDYFNNSNTPVSDINDYYKKQYWTLRKKYDEMVAKGQNTHDIVVKLTIIHDKYVEFKQMKKDTVSLVRK